MIFGKKSIDRAVFNSHLSQVSFPEREFIVYIYNQSPNICISFQYAVEKRGFF
jgi:hypothetical protein